MYVTTSPIESEVLPASTTAMSYKQFMKRQVIVNSTISMSLALIYMVLWLVGVGFCLCYCRRQSSPSSKQISFRGRKKVGKEPNRGSKDVTGSAGDRDDERTSPIQRMVMVPNIPPIPKPHKLRFIVDVNHTDNQNSRFHDRDDIHTSTPSSLTFLPIPDVVTKSMRTASTGEPNRPSDGNNDYYPHILSATGGVDSGRRRIEDSDIGPSTSKLGIGILYREEEYRDQRQPMKFMDAGSENLGSSSGSTGRTKMKFPPIPKARTRHTPYRQDFQTSFASSTSMDNIDMEAFESLDHQLTMSESHESFDSALPDSVRWDGGSTLSVNSWDHADPTRVVVQQARRVPIMLPRQVATTAMAVNLPSN